VVIDQDDGIRPGTTPASLGQLKPVFKKGGSTTAGNSSQVTDGAAAVMLMTRREADRRGLPVLGIFRSFAAVGVPPAVMGIGPAVAIPAAVEMAGLALDDVDVYEINEAFASQATYSVNKLGLDMDRVNPNGGAIALGHPLGCTGARQVRPAWALQALQGSPEAAAKPWCLQAARLGAHTGTALHLSSLALPPAADRHSAVRDAAARQGGPLWRGVHVHRQRHGRRRRV
jgi:acetyl-CoA acetyltransferase family protein